MKRAICTIGLALLLVTTLGAQAQAACTAGCGAEADQLIEEVLVVKFCAALELDQQTLSEVMQGYEMWAAKRDARKAAAAELKAAVASGSGVWSKLEALRDIDEELTDFTEEACANIATFGEEAEANLYLFISGIDQMVAQAKLALTSPCQCGPKAAQGAATATAPSATPEELIRTTVNNVKKALETQDLDLLLSTFAEDFEHPEAGGKEEIRALLERGIEMGYLDEGEVSLEDMEIEVDGDEATAYPIDLSGPPGSISIELELGKRGDKWLITVISPDGV